MANQALTALEELTATDQNDTLYVVSGGVSYQATTKNVVESISKLGAVIDVMTSTLAENRVLQSSSSGIIEVSSVTSDELGYLSGVTSAVQSQMDGKASTSHDHDGAYSRWRGVSAGDPGSNQAGDIYMDSSDSNKIKIYDGTSYIALN